MRDILNWIAPKVPERMMMVVVQSHIGHHFSKVRKKIFAPAQDNADYWTVINRSLAGLIKYEWKIKDKPEIVLWSLEPKSGSGKPRKPRTDAIKQIIKNPTQDQAIEWVEYHRMTSSLLGMLPLWALWNPKENTITLIPRFIADDLSVKLVIPKIDSEIAGNQTFPTQTLLKELKFPDKYGSALNQIALIEIREYEVGTLDQ